MKVIGLTGGIGTGKSTVAGFMAELGAAVIEADSIGHQLYRPGTPTWRGVVEAFGRDILTPDGSIDRARLGDIVFHDDKARRRLNRLTHPAIKQEIRKLIKRYRQEGKRAVLLEVPLLLEAGWASLVDEVWVTTASEATVLRRLTGRGGLSRSEAEARIRVQLPAAERPRRADVVIDTDCSLDELRAKVKALWRNVLGEAGQPGEDP